VGKLLTVSFIPLTRFYLDFERQGIGSRGASLPSHQESEIKGSVRYAGASRAAATIMDEDLHIVMEVMAKRKLEGSIAQWLAAYKADIAKVERLRMVEITDPQEYRRVMSEETVVRMAMRYEHTPQTSVADERCKCRWIVRGDQEPTEWFEELDSPTIMA
jgi:hypothetical protein